jgi:hypothetical protein
MDDDFCTEGLHLAADLGKTLDTVSLEGAAAADKASKSFDGRLAQMDRALVSGTKGRAFESRIARHGGSER